MRSAPVVLAVVLIAGSLAGCKPKPAVYHEEGALADTAAVAAKPMAPLRNAPSVPNAAASPTAPMLAYSYAYELRVAGDSVRRLMRRHEQACLSAGPAACQMTSSNVQSGDAGVEGTLMLRAAPAWVARFRGGLEREAREAGGKIVRSEVTSEDLTRSIVDADAALRAKTALRDRLQRLLESRPGKLSDLVELEKALSEVQGEIDAGQSVLTVMRGRVAMSELTVTYLSDVPFGDGGASLRHAIKGFGGNLANGTAALITLVSYLLPFLLLLGLLGYAVLRFFRRRKAKPTAPPSA